MSASANQRVRKRDAGLRPLQIWVPDARRPGFAEECRRQAQMVARADTAAPDMLALVDATLAALDKRGE